MPDDSDCDSGGDDNRIDDDGDDYGIIWTAWIRMVDCAESRWSDGNAFRIRKSDAKVDETCIYRVVIVEHYEGENYWIDGGFRELCLPGDSMHQDDVYYYIPGDADHATPAHGVRSLSVPPWYLFSGRFDEMRRDWKLAVCSVGTQSRRNEVRMACWAWIQENCDAKQRRAIREHFSGDVSLTVQLERFLLGLNIK